MRDLKYRLLRLFTIVFVFGLLLFSPLLSVSQETRRNQNVRLSHEPTHAISSDTASRKNSLASAPNLNTIDRLGLGQAALLKHEINGRDAGSLKFFDALTSVNPHEAVAMR